MAVKVKLTFCQKTYNNPVFIFLQDWGRPPSNLYRNDAAQCCIKCKQKCRIRKCPVPRIAELPTSIILRVLFLFTFMTCAFNSTAEEEEGGEEEEEEEGEERAQILSLAEGEGILLAVIAVVTAPSPPSLLQSVVNGCYLGQQQRSGRGAFDQRWDQSRFSGNLAIKRGFLCQSHQQSS